MSLQKATRVAWRKFLASDVGQEGLLYLEQQDPTISGEGEPHSIIFSAGMVQGYKKCLRSIPKLVDIAEQPTQDEENN